MNIPPKYEDVVAQLEAAREEALILKKGAQLIIQERDDLRQDLERAKSRYDREVLGLNNEGDPIGGDPAGGYKNDLARTSAAFDELASCVGFSEERLEQTGDSPMDCANQLQQRLTVAEQRVGEMNSALARIHGRAEMFIDDGMHMPTPSIEAIRDIAAKAALKPAEEDDSDLQKIGFVRMNTKTDQPRISMADMHARYERKPCQEPQDHPTRCGCEDLSHEQ